MPSGGFLKDLDEGSRFEDRRVRQQTPGSTPGAVVATRVLTAEQERRVIDYLDGQLLRISRQVKRAAKLTSLLDHLALLSPLLTIVLSIPPFSTSAGLRSSYLLRITGEVGESIDAFGLSDPDFTLLSANATASRPSPTQPVQGLLDVLDSGWACCLEAHVWNPTLRKGLPSAPTSSSSSSSAMPTPRSIPQTDRVRLSSLLLNLRASIRTALALPPDPERTSTSASREAEMTPSMTTDLDSTSSSSYVDDGDDLDEGPRGDAASTMAIRLDPDASDDEDDMLANRREAGTDVEMETDAETRARESKDASTAGALEESVGRLFHRTLRLLNDM